MKPLVRETPKQDVSTFMSVFRLSQRNHWLVYQTIANLPSLCVDVNSHGMQTHITHLSDIISKFIPKSSE